jgi:ABC-type dipeptide/oligopeptide/nickel transport system permease component
LFELAVAFVIAVAIGLVLGLAIGLQPFVRRSVFPIVLLLYGMPQITILPLFILYLRHRRGIEDRVRRHPRHVSRHRSPWWPASRTSSRSC